LTGERNRVVETIEKEETKAFERILRCEPQGGQEESGYGKERGGCDDDLKGKNKRSFRALCSEALELAGLTSDHGKGVHSYTLAAHHQKV
jgi:hypothetical protein